MGEQTPPQPQPTTTTTAPTAEPTAITANSAASKLPFRPRKIRKLAPSTATATATATATNALTLTKQPPPRIPHQPIPRSLSSDGEIEAALRHLRSSDPLLGRVIDLHQPPLFDSFNPPFLALSKSILYQQLALKAGTSIYTRFVALCGGEPNVLPDVVHALTPQQLRQIGVSARKASYLHDLASKYSTGILSDDSIVDMDDRSLLTMLNMVKGIGSWSVHMFMIFSLHRPDVLPVGDLGVRKGVQLLNGLEELPRPSQMDQLCEKWRPYRTVASWYMWKLAEAKGAPAMAAPIAVDTSQQHLQQQTQLVDSISGIANLG
ncbi:hypothetical protein Sjap_016926 [Stephania japonica]|uniref:HhH-GPD domain-containing protein n=1 Tax=Stephania japonica TaxID=461633 RepID=A0AAP0NLE5_9MAGN